MSDQEPRIEINAKYTVRAPIDEDVLPIPESEWEDLKSQIGHIGSAPLFYPTVGTWLMGIAGSALLGSLTLPRSITTFGYPTTLISWAIFFVTLITGIFALMFAWKQRELLIYSKQQVLRKMEFIERKYPPTEQGSNGKS